MRVKWSQIYAAMEHLRREANLGDSKEHEMTVTTREEDPGNGILGECVILNVAIVKKPNSYDDLKTDKTIEYTVEIWPVSENRPPRFVAVETRDIIK